MHVVENNSLSSKRKRFLQQTMNCKVIASVKANNSIKWKSSKYGIWRWCRWRASCGHTFLIFSFWMSVHFLFLLAANKRTLFKSVRKKNHMNIAFNKTNLRIQKSPPRWKRILHLCMQEFCPTNQNQLLIKWKFKNSSPVSVWTPEPQPSHPQNRHVTRLRFHGCETSFFMLVEFTCRACESRRRRFFRLLRGVCCNRLFQRLRTQSTHDQDCSLRKQVRNYTHW